MRKFSTLLLAIICTSCALQTFEVPTAPSNISKAVVFDIDGTLTPEVLAIGTAREDAAKAVSLFANNGYKIIYLSARVKLLQSGIPDWLKENGFPEGSIQVPQSSQDSNDHQAFKQRILMEFQDKGWRLYAAYGDSSTDFEAYSAVGINQERIFALQRADDEQCQPGLWSKCLLSWPDHMRDLEQILQL